MLVEYQLKCVIHLTDNLSETHQPTPYSASPLSKWLANESGHEVINDFKLGVFLCSLARQISINVEAEE